MEIELLCFEGCPNLQPAGVPLREAVRTVRAGTPPVICRIVGSPDQAERPGFGGSPAILAGGRDRFARPGGPAGLACRLHPGAGGRDHSPTAGQVEAVLADAA